MSDLSEYWGKNPKENPILEAQKDILRRLNNIESRLAFLDVAWNTPNSRQIDLFRLSILEIVSILSKKETDYYLETLAKEEVMDKQIRKIEKEVKSGKNKKAEKDLKHLEKEDKKRDRIVTAGKKAMMMKKKGKC